MKKKVLIIDDDLKSCRKLKYALQNDSTDVYYALSVKEAFVCFTKYSYCLVIMDILLTEIDGLNLLKTLRKAKTVPILVLSSRPDERDKISALMAGANGYLQKPYSLEECLAHAQSLMRLYMELHSEEQRCYTLVFGSDLIIDPIQRQVTLKGESLNLTRKEFDLLFCLASHAGQVLSRGQLYNQIWTAENTINVDDSVKNHIKRLRKKLSPSGKSYIRNVWGVGYRFYDDEKG